MTEKESGSRHAGGCACGEIRYEFGGQPIMSVHCHCRDCQQSSGSGAATVVAVEAAEFHLLSGTPKSYTYHGESGQPVRRHFCATCGAPLYTEADVLQSVRFVRAASLDDSSWVKPSAHIYCASAQPWDQSVDDLARFDRMPV